MDFEQLTGQLGQMVSLLGDSFGPKIQQFMDTASANGKVSDAKKALDQSYSNLGKAVYEKSPDKPLKGFEEQFGAVKAALDNLGQVNASVLAARGMKLCPSCGKEIPAEGSFCAFCGNKVPVPGEAENYIVSTRYGQVQGVKENGYVSYKGIPFAAPPVGELRFKPPVDPVGWDGVRICDTYGPIEPRPVNSISGVVGGSSDTPCSEDCLYLNVYTPYPDGKKRPVLFNIHGGAFQTGDHSLNSDPVGTTAMDCVLVTASYRLGVLGFLQLDRYLGEDYIQSGNSGMLDIIKALEWVHDNIEAFGGDPEKVTVAGQSAGAKMASALLCTPKAKGLFSAVMMDSGATSAIRDIHTAQEIAERFVKAYGVNRENAREKLLEEDYHCSVRLKRGVYSYQVEGREKPIRGRNLGSLYDRDNILQQLGKDSLHHEEIPIEFAELPPIFLIHSDLRLVVDLQTCVKAQQSIAYARKVTISNIQQMADTVTYIQKNGIASVDKLQEAYKLAEDQYASASKALEETRSQIRQTNEAIHYLGIYLSHKSTYKEFLSSRNKALFRSRHATEINEYEDAVKRLKNIFPEGKHPSIKDLKEKKVQLMKLREKQEEDLAPYSEQRKTMQIVTHNVSAILGRNIIERQEEQL